MNDNAARVLFETLTHVMSNQQKIMRHIGITKCDSDSRTDELIGDCSHMARIYEHND